MVFAVLLLLLVLLVLMVHATTETQICRGGRRHEPATTGT